MVYFIYEQKRINNMSTTRPKRVKRTRVLSTKVTERDNRYMQLMVNRYYEERRINQAKTSTLLRLIVKRFLRRDCPEYRTKDIYQLSTRNK